jgi:preprotein translocase subunit YajC
MHLPQNAPFRVGLRAANHETEETTMTRHREYRWIAALSVLLTLTFSGGLAQAQEDDGRGTGAVQTGDDSPATQPDPSGQDAQPGQTDDGAGQQGEGEADGEQEGQQETERESSPWGGSWPLLLMLGGVVVLYIIMGRGRRKQQHKRKEMLESLKKGDKVVTIGGIEGTVMDVKNNEITVKVDETNNIRMKFARWAVQSVGEEPTEETPQQR